MKLVTINGIDCALVERDETVDAMRLFCDRTALIFGGTAPKFEIQDMPVTVMGGGHAANYQAINAIIETFCGNDGEAS